MVNILQPYTCANQIIIWIFLFHENIIKNIYPKCNSKVQLHFKKIDTQSAYKFASGGVGGNRTRVQRRPHNDVYSLDDIMI